MSSRYDNKKVVSIEFDNQKFERDVSKTLDTINELDEATSGKKLKGDGISVLERAFSNFSKSATDDINKVNDTLSDTSAYQNLSKNLDEINGKISDGSAYDKMATNVAGVSESFSTLEIIALGALFSIGEMAVDVGQKIANTLVSGIRDGWGEYNLLMDSTQIILANTKKYGTTIEDVTAALDELNDYADRTIYNFAQMTSNLGRFTAAGANLEDSVTIIKGMSNLGALFGADNAAMQRATFQMSQAVASGKILLRDWMSLESANMNGAAMQDALLETAAKIQGLSVDEFKSMINFTGNIRDTLNSGWLTADIYLETMRKFAGESREYWESIEDSSGHRMYSDAEIDYIMEQGAAAEEAATKVRTLTQMIDALKEAIGSGWGESFRLIIGDLEQAKTFWTPINDTLTSLIGGVSKFRNDSIRAWATVYRAMSVDDIDRFLTSFGVALQSIGRGFTRVFGSSRTIGHRIGQVTEALGDLMESFILTDEELEDITDLVEGFLSPFKMLGDILFGLVKTFFDARDAMNEFDTRGESLIDKTRNLRKGFFDILGKIGRFIKGLIDLANQYGVVTGVVNLCKNAFIAIHNVLTSFFNWLGPVLNTLWNNYLVPMLNVVGEIGASVFQWLRDLKDEINSIDIHLIEDFKNIFEGLYNIFVALVDPTRSVTEAMAEFRDIIANTSIHEILNKIKDSFNGLWESLKNTRLFQFFLESIERFKNTQVGAYIFNLIENVKRLASILFDNFRSLGSNGGFFGALEYIIDTYLIPLKNKIADLGLAQTAIEMIKRVFGVVTDFISSLVTGLVDRFGGLSFETDTQVIIERIIKMVETLLMFGAIFAAVSIPKAFSNKVDDVTKKIVKPLNKLSDAIKQRMKRDTWEVIGEFFKNLAIFVIALAGSVYLLASIKDPYIAFPLLVAMLGGIALILVVITNSINSMFVTIKASGLISGLTSMMAINSVLNHVLSILSTIMIFIAGVSALAYLFSLLDAEQRSTIAIAFAAMIATFLLISSMMLLILDKILSQATVITGLSKQIKVVQGLYSSIMRSLMLIVITVALAAALMMKASGNDFTVILATVLSLIATLTVVVLLAQSLMSMSSTLTTLSPKQVNAIGKFMKMLGFTMLLISASVSILAHFGGDATQIIVSAAAILVSLTVMSFLAENLAQFASTVQTLRAGQVAKISAFMVVLSLIGMVLTYAILMISKENTDKAFGAAILVIGIIGAFALIAAKFAEFTSLLGNVQFRNIVKVASSVYLLLGALFVILTAMDKLGTMVNSLGMETVELTLEIIGGIMIGLLGIIGIMSMLQKNFTINTGSLVGAASSILIIAIALVPIAFGISMIANIDSSDSMAAIRAAESLALVLLSMSVTLGALTSVWKYLKADAALIAGAVASMVIISYSLIFIAEAIKQVASVGDIWDATGAILAIIGVISLILVGFSAISALTEGIGVAIIIGVAGGFLMMAVGLMAIGKAVMFVGEGMKLAGEGSKLFAEAMVMLEQLDAGKLTDSLLTVANFFPLMAKSINSSRPEIIGAIKTIFIGIATGITAAISLVFDVVKSLVVNGFTEHIRIMYGLMVEAFSIFLETLHSLLVVLVDFLKKEFGEGGPLREIAVAIGHFILWLAEKLGIFIVSAITKIADSISSAIRDDNIIARMVNAIKHLILSIKLALYQWLGVASPGEWAAQMVIGFFGGMLDAWFQGAETFVSGVNDLIEGATGQRVEALDNVYNAMVSGQSQALSTIGSLMNNFQSGAINDVTSQLEALEAEAETLDGVISAEEERRRRIEAEGDTSVYNPSRYYAAAAGVENWNNQLSQTPSLLESISSLFGGGSGLGDIISQFFGGGGDSSGSSIFSSLFGGDTTSLLNISGGDAGTAWGDGFSEAIGGDNNPLNTLSETDLSNFDVLDRIDYDGLTNALNNNASLPDEVSNPVITPVIDDTEFNVGVDGLVSTWNDKTYDQFAIDANTSMLLRERAEGDAATDGNVTYSYTQNIYSPEAPSPIQIYRDTNSLLRGTIA